MAFTADSTMIISASNDKTIWGWDAASMAQVQVWEGHDDTVWSVKASPDNAYIVSGSSDGTMRIWELPPSKGADYGVIYYCY